MKKICGKIDEHADKKSEKKENNENESKEKKGYELMVDNIKKLSEEINKIADNISKDPKKIEIIKKEENKEIKIEEIISEEIKKISESIKIINDNLNESFKYEILEFKNKYGINIPEDQIDPNLEEAKNKKRMYAFPEEQLNYLRYDDKGRSYIAPVYSFKPAYFDDKKYYDIIKDENSYDGTLTHLIKVCFLKVKLQFHHVKPGNYKLYLNHYFDNNAKLKEMVKIKVYIGEKEIFANDKFPDEELLKIDKLTETLICDLKKEDFELDKLDQNGDTVVRFEIYGNDGSSWKKGWFLDGVRLLFV